MCTYISVWQSVAVDVDMLPLLEVYVRCPCTAGPRAGRPASSFLIVLWCVLEGRSLTIDWAILFGDVLPRT